MPPPRAFLKPRGPDAEVIGGSVAEGTEKRPGMGRQPGKRKEADASEGQMERSNEARPESRKARRQVPYGILPCRPNEKNLIFYA